MRRFWIAWRLFFNPPKRLDVFFGDSHVFIADSILERRRHRLVGRAGEALKSRIQGDRSYRLTVVSVQPTYYICKAEVLVKSLNSGRQFWQPRLDVRRILKSVFHDLIIREALVKNGLRQ